jgi:hypothetical protein
MRLQDFWERMREAFGPLAETFALDHVMSELGGRTVVEALRDGFAAREVWEAVVVNRELSV